MDRPPMRWIAPHPPITDERYWPHAGISGVYAIINRYTGEEYIGASWDLRQRIRRHIRDLKRGKHYARKMQVAWYMWGEYAFYWVIREGVSATPDPLRYPRQPIEYLREAEARQIIGRQPTYNTNVAFTKSRYRPRFSDVWWHPAPEEVDEAAIEQRTNAEMQQLYQWMMEHHLKPHGGYWKENESEQPPATGPSAQA